jgi:hypothetical protein
VDSPLRAGAATIQLDPNDKQHQNWKDDYKIRIPEVMVFDPTHIQILPDWR